MSATTVKLLQTAAEIAGGTAVLARRLGIGEAVLLTYLADRRRLPDALLLRAVDIILADRQSHLVAPRPLVENRQALLRED
jgi:hypothetical protein